MRKVTGPRRWRPAPEARTVRHASHPSERLAHRRRLPRGSKHSPPRSDVLGFVQFNNEERRTDFDFRYHWIPALGDDLLVV